MSIVVNPAWNALAPRVQAPPAVQPKRKPVTLAGMASLPAGIRHVRPPRPLQFPATDAEGEVGQTKRHWNLCTLLYAILKNAVAGEHTVGADQFVFFDRSDLRRCIAPDVFVRLGTHLDDFDSWKIWEKGGPPEACFEILSKSDTPANVSLENKLASYAAMGTREVFTFDFDAAEGTRLRAWDGIGGDLVERVVEGERTPCLSLDCDVVVVANPMEGELWGLRVERGGVLLPTQAEAALDGERAALDGQRAALARVAELEAALAKRGRRK